MKKKYYDLSKLLECGCNWNILYGMRSNGKSYAVKEHTLKQAFNKGVKFVYLRRWSEDIKTKDVDTYFDDIDIIFTDFVKPFDLSCAPLFRTKIVRFTNGKSAMFVDMHHIIADGTSLNILIDELSALYNNTALPELTLTYKEFASFENQKLETNELKEAKDYWINQFSDELPVLNMPIKSTRPNVQNFEGKKVYSSINSTITQKIDEFD